MSTTRSYFPGLDGLRGLAILSVMLYHFFDSRFAIDQTSTWDLNPFRLGWVGVDVFFVISGFLITNILLCQKEHPHYFRNFFLRRTLRIFPLYFGFLFLFFTLPSLLSFQMPHSWENLANRQEFFWFYLADLYTFCFNSWPELSLSHFWSLGIEEKFYLFWPFIIWFFSQTQLRWICVLLFILSISSKLFMLGYHENGILVNYTFPLCRLEGLAAGAYLAILQQRNKEAIQVKGQFWLFLILALYLGIYLFEKTLAPMTLSMQLIGFPLNAVVGFFIVCSALRPDSLTTHLLNHKTLRLLGKYSYALYLLHLPLLGLITKFNPISKNIHPIIFSALPFLLWLFLSIFCAWVSWTIWENPFLKLKQRFQYTAS